MLFRNPFRDLAPDKQVLLEAHKERWSAIGLQTGHCDQTKARAAIESIYFAAGLPPPRVVFAPSPLAMVYVFGAAAALWGAYRFASDAALSDVVDATLKEATKKPSPRGVSSWRIILSDYDLDPQTCHTAGTVATIVAQRAVGRKMVELKSYAQDLSNYYASTFIGLDTRIDASREAIINSVMEVTRPAVAVVRQTATDGPLIDGFNAGNRAALIAACKAEFGSMLKGLDLDGNLDQILDVASDAIQNATRGVVSTAHSADEMARAAVSACTGLAGRLGIEFATYRDFFQDDGNLLANAMGSEAAQRDILGDGPEEGGILSCQVRAAMHSGIRLMHENFCVVSEFPELLKWDEQKRFHCEDGPSHRWADGWCLYHWHGVAIPQAWIEDRASLSAQTALTWKNIEQRWAACGILGWARILAELHVSVIDQDADPAIGTLLEAVLPDIGVERFLRVRCGTGREFAIPVPRHCGDTARAANAWTNGLQAHSFMPAVRT